MLKVLFMVIIIIFEVNLQDTFTRCEKYRSKLHISRSFIIIFAELYTLR